MKKINLYIYHKTVLNCKNIRSLDGVLPSIEQIVEHIKVQMSQPKEQLKPIGIELEESKFTEIQNEIIRKTCLNKRNEFILIYLETINHPIILITIKK